MRPPARSRSRKQPVLDASDPHLDTLYGPDLGTRAARAGVIGLGYVGLPLAIAVARGGFPVIGFDIDPTRSTALECRPILYQAVPRRALPARGRAGGFAATADFAELARLRRHRHLRADAADPAPRAGPLLRRKTARVDCRSLRTGQLIVLESTTYPGTTDEVVKPILEATGLKSGTDFFLAFSPEREDPGNRDFEHATIPKVVGGDGAEARDADGRPSTARGHRRRAGLDALRPPRR